MSNNSTTLRCQTIIKNKPVQTKEQQDKEEENDLFSLCIKDGMLENWRQYEEQPCPQSYRTILM